MRLQSKIIIAQREDTNRLHKDVWRADTIKKLIITAVVKIAIEQSNAETICIAASSRRLVSSVLQRRYATIKVEVNSLAYEASLQREPAVVFDTK
jgi:hypothetical protein